VIRIGEMVALALVVIGACVGADIALDRTLEQAALRAGPLVRDAAAAEAEARLAMLAFAAGFAVLAGARAWSLRRAASPLAVPLFLPAVAGAAGLGLIVQMGYGDPIHAQDWPGPGFAHGVGLACLLAAALVVQPWDLTEVLHRFRVPLAVTAGIGAVLLRFAGTGPAGTDTHINLALGGAMVQPLEAVKLLFVALLGVTLGRRAARLRWHRIKVGPLRVPRPALFVGSLLFLLAVFGGLVLVNDLGPSLILALVFLGVFYAATRSAGWVVVAFALVAAATALIAADPSITGSTTLETRFQMWLDPWLNGRRFGSQLAHSLWAIAAGGLHGRGLGHAMIGALEAGHTDLALAHLAEETGLWGGLTYLGLLGAVVVHGLWVAARTGTPERALLAGGCSLLLLAQWVVIFGGTTGLLPLTGVVVPFLSFGKSSMAMVLVAAVLPLHVAERGPAAVVTRELRELRATLSVLLVASVLTLAAAGGWLAWLGVMNGPATSARAVVTTLRDGTVRLDNDPRLEAISGQLLRGEILDRNDEVLAGTAPDGSRTWPLGDDIGTLLGPPDGDLTLRQPWMLERQYETVLRGYPDRARPVIAWKTRGPDGRERLVLAVEQGTEPDDGRERAEALADGAAVRPVAHAAADLTAFVPLLHLRPVDREAAIDAVVQDKASRSVRLSLDARLVARIAAILDEAAEQGEAAAAVVLDVHTGRILARVQVPDVDLSSGTWIDRLEAGEPRFVGIYGPWPDKTGVRGFFQAGSAAKLFTALAAVRNGIPVHGQGCAVRTGWVFPCTLRDADGPYFTTPGWPRPVHDHHLDANHGADLELVGALEDSCNVYFGQLGLDLGPASFQSLVADGVDMGWDTTFEPGPAGSRQLASTAFGQGAAALNVSQAARLVATIGSGGVYRRCPPDLALDAACEETLVTDHEPGLQAVLAGMSRAMTHGTAHRLDRVDGVRIYGKTGTADAAGMVDEQVFGYEPGATGLRPHSWFVALAEPADAEACGAHAPGRLAIAVVVPRGGGGAEAAGPAAIRIIEAAHDLGYLQ